jgi:hypothetical protein
VALDGYVVQGRENLDKEHNFGGADACISGWMTRLIDGRVLVSSTSMYGGSARATTALLLISRVLNNISVDIQVIGTTKARSGQTKENKQV